MEGAKNPVDEFIDSVVLSIRHPLHAVFPLILTIEQGLIALNDWGCRDNSTS